MNSTMPTPEEYAKQTGATPFFESKKEQNDFNARFAKRLVKTNSNKDIIMNKWRKENPESIGDYIVTNDGIGKIRLGMAYWNGKE